MVRTCLSKHGKQYCEDCERISPRQRRLNKLHSRRRAQRAQQSVSGSQINATQNLPQHDGPIAFAGYWPAEDEDETINAARTMIALSQGIQTVPNLPRNATEPFLPTTPFAEFQSGQDEDEAYNAALILANMRQGNVHAPLPSQLQQQMNVVPPQQAPQHPMNRGVLPRPPPYQVSRNIMQQEPSVTVTNPPRRVSSYERPRSI
ncbi:hypothetical protein MMC29_001112 [Sticta canariensis]|nr:hypothetical protein [Sticta canariensis]